jgi:hypothetical protein
VTRPQQSGTTGRNRYWQKETGLFYISPLSFIIFLFSSGIGIGTAPARCFVVTRPVNQRQNPGREILKFPKRHLAYFLSANKQTRKQGKPKRMHPIPD